MTSPLIQRYDKARNACALFHMEDWAVFQLAGSDTTDYLHRISTADIKTVRHGHAVQTLFLQGDGRLVADCVAFSVDDNHWLLVCPATCREALNAQLDRYLFAEDVKVTDRSSDFYTGLFLGPKRMAFAENLKATCQGHDSDAHVFTVTFAPEAHRGFVLIPGQLFANLKSGMYSWLDHNDGVIGDLDLYHTFRMESGCPVFGKDLSEKTIPLEAGLKPAISFTKGCFPGQEIVARINNLGHPANVLVGLTVPETMDSLVGRELHSDGKVVGRITSMGYSPLLKAPFGLGYVKWARKDPGTILTLSGDEAYQATVIELPVPGSAS